MFGKRNIILYFARNMSIVVGLVLVWRGIWHLLDAADLFYFDGNPFYTALGGIIIGLAILYLPDKDLKELEKL